MLVPRVTFNESNIGTSPIRTGIRNRIGIVGEFSRGPANAFNYINGFSDFAARYGSDLAKGSLAFQAAFDQGARDFGVIRVLGHGKAAYGSVLFNGIASKNNTLLMQLKYVGLVNAKFGTVLETPIFTGGSYNDTVNGRYHFLVDSVSAGVATIKYKFYDLIEASLSNQPIAIDWTTITDTILVNLATDKGVAKTGAALNGVTLKFGTPTQTNDIRLKKDQSWTVRVNSFTYETNVFKDALPNQVTAGFISGVQGVAPLGNVVANSNNNGASFFLDETDDSFLGKVGEGHSYYFELAEPDAVVKATGAYNATASADKNKITVTGSNGTYVKVGAAVSSNTAGLVPNNITVTSAVTTAPGGVVTTVLTLSADLVPPGGTAGNSLFTFTHGNGLSVSPYLESSMQFFTGGVEGPRNAFVDFYSLNGDPLLRIYAVSAGSWGNNLKVSIYSIDQSKFRIVVKDTAGTKFNPVIDNESYIIDLNSKDAVSSIGNITALNASNLVRGTVLPVQANPDAFDVSVLNVSVQRLAPADNTITDIRDIRHTSFFGPTKLNDISLENGHNGPRLTEDDYIKALNELREAPCHIILAAGIYEYPSVKSHLISIAETSTELEGLKIAILNTRPNLTPGSAHQETIGLDSKRAVMVAGWSTYSGQANAPRFGLAPDAVYAGKLATIPYYVSPAARTSAGNVISVIETDIQKYNSLTSLQVYTDARIEVISLDISQGGFFLTTGRTLSSSTAWDKIIVRRTYDIIRQDLYINLQQYKSEPHTKLLRKQIASSINAYMAVLARNSRIANFSGATCDESNNPANSYTTGELYVTLSFLPLNAVDQINVTFIRNTEGGLQIGD